MRTSMCVTRTAPVNASFKTKDSVTEAWVACEARKFRFSDGTEQGTKLFMFVAEDLLWIAAHFLPS